MSPEENERLRTDLWDLIFQQGPMSLEQLSERAALSVPSVLHAVEHPWFSIHGELVSIANQQE